MSYGCPHARLETRRRTYANDTVHVVEQCLDCGSQLRAIPKTEWLGKLVPGRLPVWDEELPRTYIEARQEGWRREVEERRGRESAEWWANYNAYLQSPSWRALRAKVLQRDGFNCQGCGRPGAATQVHHLTYERVGREMMFDLVAVCEACHKAIHAPKNGGAKCQ